MHTDVASLIVDVILIGFALSAFAAGWRHGAIGSVLSAIGVVAGCFLGLAIAPVIMRSSLEQGVSFILALVVLVVVVWLCSYLGANLGYSVHRQFRTRAAMRLNSVLGAILHVPVVLVVCWFVAQPLGRVLEQPAPPVARGIEDSRVLGAVDSLAPRWLHSVPSRLSSLIDDAGLPHLVDHDPNPLGREVAAPDQELANPQVIAEVRPSVIHVMGAAETCQRRLMGSGFVTAPDYVVTNAHVVAGTNSVRLDTVLGVKDADVVYFDPELDIAVLYSPDLGISPLPWAAKPAASGDDAVVLGYPESGPFEAAPARIADRLRIAGADIYAQGSIEREAYSVRGTIREGNSGGPLLTPQGEVMGVVFGASRDVEGMGFALTAEEVRSHIGDVTELTQLVDTAGCVQSR
ncbi:MarP family serine protease [Corynebacterium tapiri]|uniref:MarP family serine protease n=1 Tax=Corynebacterium tapiri TaxID=1448266 RepID=UPI001FE3D96F|nr:MarP family serine protease [Corynebacterium tapiri]